MWLFKNVQYVYYETDGLILYVYRMTEWNRPTNWQKCSVFEAFLIWIHIDYNL